MKTMYRLFALAILAVLVQACAFTDSVVTIDYKPTKHVANQKPASETVLIEKFTDQRGCEPTLLSYKGVMHRTSGKYLSDREVGAIITDATKALLVSLGYSVVNEAEDFKLSGEILKFDSTPIVGFWSGELEGVVQLNLRLKESKSGNIVWHEMISGTAKKTGIQMDGDDHRKEVTENTLDALMGKIADSRSLKDILERKAQAKKDPAVKP